MIIDNLNENQSNEAPQPLLRVGGVISGAFCSHCYELFEKKFVEDFVDGVCLPCQSQIFIENEDRLDLECLAKYNKKHKTNFTIDSFWESAQNGEIEKSTCKGFPRMREILEWFEMIEAEYLAEQEYWKNYQPTLFDNVSELPF